MSVKLEDRPIEQVREEVIDKLIVNYSHGVISSDAFERRLDDAMKSESNEALVALIADLTMDADPKYESTKEQQFTPNYGPSSYEDELKLNCVLGSVERSGQWQVPKRIKLFNLLGSATLDFSDAIFCHQHVTIEINSILAGEDIYIPENVNVVCKTFGIGSSLENTAPSIASRQAPTITIEGRSILSSLEVKIKRTMKEKILAFAEQVKGAFQQTR